MNIKTPVLIFSAESTKNSELENIQATCELRDILETTKTRFKEVLGVYEGFSETSYVVADTTENRRAVLSLCADFDQDCFLAIDANDGVFFEYLNGRAEFCGRFSPVSRDRALKSGDYTYCTDLDQYYIIER